MKKSEVHISFDPYREDGSGTTVISTDEGFITKDSREVWDVVKPKIKELIEKPWITTVVSGTINDSITGKDFIEDSKYDIDTKWLEENNECNEI